MLARALLGIQEFNFHSRSVTVAHDLVVRHFAPHTNIFKESHSIVSVFFAHGARGWGRPKERLVRSVVHNRMF
jgi:hypothetical protein